MSSSTRNFTSPYHTIQLRSECGYPTKMADGIKPPKPVKNIPKDILNSVANKENRKNSVRTKSSTLPTMGVGKAKDVSPVLAKATKTDKEPSHAEPTKETSKEPSTSKTLPSRIVTSENCKEGDFSKSPSKTGGLKKQTMTEKSVLSEAVDQSFPPGSGNVYEPLSAESMDIMDRVYTKCKNNSLGRSQLHFKPAKESRKPELKECLRILGKPERIVVGVYLAILTVVMVITFVIAVVALVLRGSLDCHQVTETTAFLQHTEVVTTMKSLMDVPGYVTSFMTCTYDEGTMDHLYNSTTATLYHTPSHQVYCRCTRESTITGNASTSDTPIGTTSAGTAPACTLRITRCRV